MSDNDSWNAQRNQIALKSAVLGLVLACAWAPVARGGQSQTTPGGTDTGRSCRTYVAEGTTGSVGRGVTTTVTYKAVYNPSTRQITTTGSASDSRGIKQSWVTVTTYRSTADVVDEVKVIPPLTLSTGTTSTGNVAFTLKNSYDSQRRLTGFTSAQEGGTTTVQYTAWDSSGRPTAGTQTTPEISSTLALSYDDAARTLTTTITSGKVVGVGTQTFDADGNPTVYHQTVGTAPASTSTTTIQSTTTVCK